MKITIEPTSCFSPISVGGPAMRVWKGKMEDGRPVVFVGITLSDQTIITEWIVPPLAEIENISLQEAFERFGKVQQ